MSCSFFIFGYLSFNQIRLKFPECSGTLLYSVFSFQKCFSRKQEQLATVPRYLAPRESCQDLPVSCRAKASAFC